MDKKNKEKKNKEHKESRREKQLREVQNELNKLVEDLNTVMGDEAPDIKVINASELGKKKKLYFFIELLISLITLTSLSGYFKWIEYEKVYQLFIVIVGIVAIETILINIIDTFFIKLVLYTIGSIHLFASAFAFILTCICVEGIKLMNFWKAFFVFVLYISIKKLTMYFIKGKTPLLFRR